jgi:lysophospholipase L1-like esterase
MKTFANRPLSSRFALVLGFVMSCAAAQTPFRARLECDEISGWQVKFGSEAERSYRLQSSVIGEDLWNWVGDEMIASGSESALPVTILQTEPRRFWRVARLTRRIAFLGDSITASSSGYQVYSPPIGMPRYMHRSYSGYAAAILGQAFKPTVNAYSFDGPDNPDWDFGWGGITAAAYLTSTVNAVSSGGDKYPGVTLTPVQAAIASDPDAFVVLIGTNDTPWATAATVTNRIAAVLDVLRATGKQVFCGTVLPRLGDTVSPTVEPIQTRIDAVNAALPAVCSARGATLVSWHEALMTGGVQNPVYFGDAAHPNSGGHAVMGCILANALRPYMGSEFALPLKGDPRWVTTNPYMDVDSNMDGKADGFVFTYFSTNDLALETVAGVTWQRCVEPDLTQGVGNLIYAPAMSAVMRDALAATQTPLRLACRYEIVSGDCGAIGLSVSGKIGLDTKLLSGYYVGANYDGPLEHHQGLMLTGKFSIPDGTTELKISLSTFGGSVLRIRQFGIFEAP